MMSEQDLTGQIFIDGKYKLGSKLGSGAFGTVYLAEENWNGIPVRNVALKIYSPESTKNATRAMYKDCVLPATILASNVPEDEPFKRHFVEIYDFGKIETEQGDCAYLAMQLLTKANTLSKLTEDAIRTSKYPSEETVVNYMLQFFEALSLAHRRGVLHRDIKGDNVMITGNVIRIIDFGMGACITDLRSDFRTTIWIYAPENFKSIYTTASDIYQAGLMFYYFYTGFNPFANTNNLTPDEYMAQAYQERISFRYKPSEEFKHRGVHVSPLLDSVLSKCLAFSETERYCSAQEVIDALKNSRPEDIVFSAVENKQYKVAIDRGLDCLTKMQFDIATKARLKIALGKAYSALGEFNKAWGYFQEAEGMVNEIKLFFETPEEYTNLIHEIVSVLEKLGYDSIKRIYIKKLEE